MTTENKQKKSTRGGVRPGAGRPRGSRERITVQGLISALEQEFPEGYEQVLAADFARSRRQGDTQAVIKYHNLILNKVMATLHDVEVRDTQDMIAARRAAFEAALAAVRDRPEDK